MREVEERFASRVLPLSARRTPEVNALIPELYLHGLAAGDFDLALRRLLGEDAPVSASSVGRLKATCQIELEAWKTRRKEERDHQIEQIGKKMRSMMPFLEAREVPIP